MSVKGITTDHWTNHELTKAISMFKDGAKYREIAEALERTIASTKSQLHYRGYKKGFIRAVELLR
jgi:hypothetical protein